MLKYDEIFFWQHSLTRRFTFFRKIIFFQNSFFRQIFPHKYFSNKQKNIFLKKQTFRSTFEDLLNVFHNLKNIIVQKKGFCRN